MGRARLSVARRLRLLLVVVVVSACARPTPPQDEVVFAIGTWPTNLDPRFAPDAWSDKIARLVFAPLLRLDDAGEPQPHVAKRWTWESPTEVVVHLRPDARFSNGAPVTPRDVVATYRSILDPALGSVKRLLVGPIASVDEAGPHAVRFELQDSHAPFLQVLAGVGIASASDIESSAEDGTAVWTGCGPFLFDSVETGANLRLRRNSEWFGAATGAERVTFRVVPDATVRSLELLRGSADMTQNDLPPHVLAHLAEAEGLVVERAESTLVKYLAFNLLRPPLDDVRVRRAIALAIDRDAITRHKLRGYATVAHSFLHPDSWAYADDVAQIVHDPTRAEQLLDDAGLPRPDDGGPRLRLVYRTSQDETAVAVARILRRQLAAVGIDMELRSNEWGVFFADIKQGDFDLYTLSGVGIDDPDWYSFVMHSGSQPPHGANRERYASPTMDALLEAGKRTRDREVRRALYAQVQHLAARDLPLLPLWYQHNVTVRGEHVEGWAMTPRGSIEALEFVGKAGDR